MLSLFIFIHTKNGVFWLCCWLQNSARPKIPRYRYLSINLAAILVANLYVMNDMLKALGPRRVQGPRVVPNLR